MKEEEVEVWLVPWRNIVKEIAKRLWVLVLENREKLKIEGTFTFTNYYDYFFLKL